MAALLDRLTLSKGLLPNAFFCLLSGAVSDAAIL